MNWLQKISNIAEFDDIDDGVWTYDDYKAKQNSDLGYQSIGHTSPNTSIWQIDPGFRFRQVTPEDLQKHPYEKRHHGLLNPSFGDDSIAHGRVDLDAMEGSISIMNSELNFPNVRSQMKIFNMLINKYPGVKFFVYRGPGEVKISLQQYIKSME